jgi:hypothetical protein
MAGWSRERRLETERNFYRFLDRCFVNSRDGGHICLGKTLYEGQRKVVTDIFDALEEDIHDIWILKSRQLGISTIIRALIVFMIGIHKGVKGALVFDSAQNREEARADLVTMIRDLPPSLKFPKVRGTGEGNREGLTLVNASKILFKSAGVKKSKASGTLGRSVGLSLCHCSELSSWDNQEGFESFKQSLSDTNPDRLYIFESTARGFNQFYQMIQDAKDDPHCKFIFLGFWSKQSQRIDRSDPDWLRYGVYPPTDREIEKVKAVKALYDVDVTPEQLAWIRRKYDPAAQADGDAPPDFEPTTERLQEQCFTEDDAWQSTGSVFFANEKITDQSAKHASSKFKTYYIHTSDEFYYTRVLKAENKKMVHLKVWDEPEPSGGVYVMGIDPAFGENENNCRSAIEVLRCYADGIDQVAEYASPLVRTDQFAWVIAMLMGWYGMGDNEVRYILEINGPGTSTFNALKSLKFQLEHGRQSKEIFDRGLQDVFKNVKTYVYSRADAMGSGSNYHFKTDGQRKIDIMEGLRNYVSSDLLHVRSLDLLDELKTIARDGDKIGAPPSMFDDRAVAMALATHYYDTKIRNNMIAMRRTRESEAARKRLSITDQVYLFQQNQLQAFFDQKRSARIGQQLAATRYGWRGRR